MVEQIDVWYVYDHEKFIKEIGVISANSVRQVISMLKCTKIPNIFPKSYDSTGLFLPLAPKSYNSKRPCRDYLLCIINYSSFIVYLSLIALRCKEML